MYIDFKYILHHFHALFGHSIQRLLCDFFQLSVPMPSNARSAQRKKNRKQMRCIEKKRGYKTSQNLF